MTNQKAADNYRSAVFVRALRCAHILPTLPGSLPAQTALILNRAGQNDALSASV